MNGKPYNLCIATAAYFGPYGNCRGDERRSYLERMIESWVGIEWPEGLQFKWLISDDASPVDVPPFPPHGDRCDVEIVKQPKNLGNQQNILWVCGEAAKQAYWVLYADNDGIFAKDCITRMLNLAWRFPWAMAYSAFNTKYHYPVPHPVTDERLIALGVHEVEGSDYSLKASGCEHGLMFRADDWLNDNSWVCSLHSGIKDNVGPYPCLKPSGLQHIGKRGLSGTTDDYDAAFKEEGVTA